MRKRDYLFIVVLLLIGWWAIPHVKEDVTRAFIPDRVERLFPRLVDRIIRPKRQIETVSLEPDRRMQSPEEISRLMNADPPVAATSNVALDHGYGW